MGDEDQGDQEFSDDEGLIPDRPAFTGLFHPTLFKSLLYKAKTTAPMGVAEAPAEPPLGLQDPSERLFSEPAAEQDVIPSPKLFIDVIQRQWNQPGSLSAPVGMTGGFIVLVWISRSSYSYH